MLTRYDERGRMTATIDLRGDGTAIGFGEVLTKRYQIQRGPANRPQRGAGGPGRGTLPFPSHPAGGRPCEGPDILERMTQPVSDAPLSGGIPYAIGQASVVRIPIPGTQGLCIELRPRGFVPKGGSTSTLFFQDPSGKRHLRLDYGYNVRTRTIDYHWNQKGTHANFGIADHAPAGRAGQGVANAAKYFRYAGRVLIVAGVAIDIVSIAQASKPLRRASQVVAGWAGAWAGCKVVGAGGAAGGTFVAPGVGTAVGGVGGCIIGGIGGYWGASALAGEVYDWAEGTFFTPLPEVARP
jgi:hypothetical protein